MENTATDIALYEEIRQKIRKRSVKEFKTYRRKYEELQAFKDRYYKGVHTSNKIMHEIVMREGELTNIAAGLDFPEFDLVLDLRHGVNVPDPVE